MCTEGSVPDLLCADLPAPLLVWFEAWSPPAPAARPCSPHPDSVITASLCLPERLGGECLEVLVCTPPWWHLAGPGCSSPCTSLHVLMRLWGSSAGASPSPTPIQIHRLSPLTDCNPVESVGWYDKPVGRGDRLFSLGRRGQEYWALILLLTLMGKGSKQSGRRRECLHSSAGAILNSQYIP